MKRFLSAVAVAVAVAVAAPDVASAAEVDTGAAEYIANRVNQERANRGLTPLTLRADVSEIALGHSQAMAARTDIWHNGDYFTTATRQRLGARGLGENVALNGDIEAAHQRLWNSPAHQANILNGGFDTIGVGVVREGGTLYITQNFVDTAEASPAAPAKITKAKGKAKATKAKGKGKTRRARSIRRR